MTPRLNLTFQAHVAKAEVPRLRRYLRKAHGIVSPALANLSIVLVNDRTMADLHQQFMNIPGPTDVLTFSIDTNASGQVTSGEVIICVPEARRRSKLERTTLPDELLLYALHGMLHLCGFDDRTDRQYRIMHRTEDDILTRLGVGPVFNHRHLRGAR